MEKSLKIMMIILIILVALNLLTIINAIESPQFTVIHSESEFEIRVYRNSTWMSASVNHLSFHQATKLGFHRLFQYIQGANLNFSRIPMTKPVLTSIVPGAGPLHSSAYFVRFYLPEKFQATPPLPLPELNLKPISWPCHCVAVRKFSGYARDGNVVTEAKKLAISLGRSPWANSTSADRISAYSIAQYSSPFRIIGRVNEVWVNVDGSEEDNCMSSSMVAIE